MENTAAHCRVVETLLTKGPYGYCQPEPQCLPEELSRNSPPPLIRRELKPAKEPGVCGVGVWGGCEGV